MQRIIVKEFYSSGFNEQFNNVYSIDIEDKPFAEGGFGEVYVALKINNREIAIPQVIKIFKDNDYTIANECLATIKRLQKKFSELNRLLKTQGKDLIGEYPAFQAVPQFSFEGILNNRYVQGFSSDNLTLQGYVEFEKILLDEKLLNKFYDIPLQQRIYFAYQLAQAFKVLDEFKYIHADLKPSAIFLNLEQYKLALIDFDSGVITENPGDEPLTWGAPGDWVAPEVWLQLKQLKSKKKIIVDAFTDRWSVAVGIHYLITGLHPLFYLSELSERITTMYFAEEQWPNANMSKPYFLKENSDIYKKYVEFLNTSLPAEIKEKLAHAINFGYRNSVARPNYKEWTNILKLSQTQPKIKTFIISKKELFEDEQVTIAWNVENALKTLIYVDNIYFQEASPIDKIKLTPQKSSEIKFKFEGLFGTIEQVEYLNVIPKPRIIFLNVQPDKIRRNVPAKLLWRFEKVSFVRLWKNRHESIEVQDEGEYSFIPTTTSTFKFELVALDNKTSFYHYVIAEVIDDDIQINFCAQSEYVLPHQPVILSWEVKNANRIEIKPNIGPVEAIGSKEMFIENDTIFTLVATNSNNTVEKHLKVCIVQLPQIETIYIPCPVFTNQNEAIKQNFSLEQKLVEVNSLKCDKEINLVELKYQIYEEKNNSLYQKINRIWKNILKQNR